MFFVIVFNNKGVRSFLFTYFKSAFKNAKPQLLITFIYALIAFAVIAVVYLLANFQLAKYLQTIAIYSQFGQKPPVDAYLKLSLYYL